MKTHKEFMTQVDNKKLLKDVWYGIRNHTNGGARQLAYNAEYISTACKGDGEPLVCLALPEHQQTLKVFLNSLTKQSGLSINLRIKKNSA